MSDKFKDVLLLSIILCGCYIIISFIMFGWFVIKEFFIHNLYGFIIMWLLSFIQAFIIIDFLEDFK